MHWYYMWNSNLWEEPRLIMVFIVSGSSFEWNCFSVSRSCESKGVTFRFKPIKASIVLSANELQSKSRRLDFTKENMYTFPFTCTWIPLIALPALSMRFKRTAIPQITFAEAAPVQLLKSQMSFSSVLSVKLHGGDFLSVAEKLFYTRVKYILWCQDNLHYIMWDLLVPIKSLSVTRPVLVTIRCHYMDKHEQDNIFF